MTHLGNPEARQTIIRRLAALSPQRPARWGRMNASQMICHLADSSRAVMGEKPVSPATGIPQRTVVKWIALYVPIPWPKGVPTRPEMEQGLGGTPPAGFARDRCRSGDVIQSFSDVDKQRAGRSCVQYVRLLSLTCMPQNVPEDLSRTIDTLYRSESGRILATLARLLGDLDVAEEAMHEAFAAALGTWPQASVPDKPRPWLISTARFKAINGMRRRARFVSAQKDPRSTSRRASTRRLTRMRKSRTTASVSSLPAAVPLCRRKHR